MPLWSFFSNETFELLLQLLPVGKTGDVAPLPARELGQLYQALDWLQPSPAASVKQQQTWSQLQAQLESLGRRPPPDTVQRGTEKLCAALKEQQLKFTSNVLKGIYTVAV